MSEAYIGEIRMVGFNFAPLGWASCDGQLMPIAQYDALFSLIGTIYGGDGEQTFALPNLNDRVPIHAGGGFVLGQRGGEWEHTLTAAEMPAHTHPFMASAADADKEAPGGALPARAAHNAYSPGGSRVPMGGAVSTIGAGQPHSNAQPYQAVHFIICLEGVYPQRG